MILHRTVQAILLPGMAPMNQQNSPIDEVRVGENMLPAATNTKHKKKRSSPQYSSLAASNSVLFILLLY